MFKELIRVIKSTKRQHIYNGLAITLNYSMFRECKAIASDYSPSTAYVQNTEVRGTNEFSQFP